MFTYLHLHTPLSPSLISLIVSVDVKHHIDLLTPPYPLSPFSPSLMVSVDIKHHVYLLASAQLHAGLSVWVTLGCCALFNSFNSFYFTQSVLSRNALTKSKSFRSLTKSKPFKSITNRKPFRSITNSKPFVVNKQKTIQVDNK